LKFLTGLLAGAALILALTGELHQGKVADLAGSMWSVLLQGTADYLFPAVDGVIPDAATRESEAERPMPLLETASIPAPAPAPAQAVPVPADEATEFVWKPFQSKISASGFANRLALSLDHPFDVHRQGPGRYQVGFTYESDEERALVLQRIARITGTTR